MNFFFFFILQSIQILQHLYRRETLSWCVIFCWIRRIYQLLSACCQVNIKDSDWGQRFFIILPSDYCTRTCLFSYFSSSCRHFFFFFNLFTLFLVTEVKLCNGRSAGRHPTTEGLSAVCVCSGVVPDAGAGGDIVTWWRGTAGRQRWRWQRLWVVIGHRRRGRWCF